MAENKQFIAKNGVDNNNKVLINVASPTADNHAANRAYVDSADTGIRDDIEEHTSNIGNPHNVTVLQIGAIAKTIGTNKGDLIVFTASATPTNLASGSVNGRILSVNTSTTTGLEWVDPLDVVYELPIATDTVLGGVKDGTNITIDGTGLLSLDDNIVVTSIVTGAITIGTKHKAEEFNGYTIFRYIG